MRVEKDYELSRVGDVERRAKEAEKRYSEKTKEEIAALGDGRTEAKVKEITEQNRKLAKEERTAILETKPTVEAEAKKRVAEIDEEIADLKRRQAAELPALKEEDELAKRVVKVQKQEAKRIEREERAKRTRKNG